MPNLPIKPTYQDGSKPERSSPNALATAVQHHTAGALERELSGRRDSQMLKIIEQLRNIVQHQY